MVRGMKSKSGIVSPLEAFDSVSLTDCPWRSNKFGARDYNQNCVQHLFFAHFLFQIAQGAQKLKAVLTFELNLNYSILCVVYIDWDVNFQTEEKYLHFKLETNSKAIWFIEANQIECTHKSPIIIAEEMEGMFKNMLARQVISILPFLKHLEVVCNTSINQPVILSRSTMEWVTLVTVATQSASIRSKTTTQCWSKMLHVLHM